MGSFLFVVNVLNILGLVLGQHDFLIDPDSADSEFEDSHALSSCKWHEPPENGVNFRPCSTGICRGDRGSYSKNGTVRFTRCKRHFVLSEGYDRDICLNGKWTSSGHKCVQCGKSRNAFNKDEEITLIHYGRNSSRGDFPWMAGIYTTLDEGRWEQICGGTLISPNLVLSGGTPPARFTCQPHTADSVCGLVVLQQLPPKRHRYHCCTYKHFIEKEPVALNAAHCFSLSGTDLQPENVKIGLGKLFVDYYNNEPGALVLAVKQIIKPERYVGVSHLYDLDIAIVVLSQSVTTDNNIMPACIDWDAQMKLKHDESGTLAGWGVTETGARSSTLKWAYQKYIAYENCRTTIKPSDQKYLTHDKFCTGEVKGGKADKGDSGGGLTFIRDSSVHYIYGIVSTKLFGDVKNTRLFTNLMDDGHRAWLLQNWRKLQVQHGQEECSSNQDCPRDDVCKSGKCQDPCSFACGENTSCKIINHLTTCACRSCHVGDPITGCVPMETCGPKTPSTQRKKKYTLVKEKANWFAAVQKCVQDNKILATIKSAEEMKIVVDLIDQNQMTYTTFWIGGSDLAKEGTFVWVDTNAPFDYVNFRAGEPANYLDNEDCVEVWNRQWNDIDCTRKEFYICQSY